MKKIADSNPEPEVIKSTEVPNVGGQPPMTVSPGGGAVKKSDNTTMIFVIIGIVVVIGFLIYLKMQKSKDGKPDVTQP